MNWNWVICWNSNIYRNILRLLQRTISFIYLIGFLEKNINNKIKDYFDFTKSAVEVENNLHFYSKIICKVEFLIEMISFYKFEKNYKIFLWLFERLFFCFCIFLKSKCSSISIQLFGKITSRKKINSWKILNILYETRYLLRSKMLLLWLFHQFSCGTTAICQFTHNIGWP